MAIAPDHLTIVLALLVSAGSLAADGDLYVATNGNDAWSGALPAPNAKHGPFGPLGKRGAEVTVRTPEDRVPPSIESVWAHDALTRVAITFSEPVVRDSAEATSSYTIEPACTVEKARPSTDPTCVILTVTPLSSGRTYTLKVRNVTDCAVARNRVSPQAQITFQSLRPILHYTMDAAEGETVLDASGNGHGKLKGGCEWDPIGLPRACRT